jgi:hypothetical protein
MIPAAVSGENSPRKWRVFDRVRVRAGAPGLHPPQSAPSPQIVKDLLTTAPQGKPAVGKATA